MSDADPGSPSGATVVGVYWYAPFNNATELDLASEVVGTTGIRLFFHSVEARFGSAMVDPDDLPFTVRRDLPPPASESGRRLVPIRQVIAVLRRTMRRRRVVREGFFDLLHIHTFHALTDWLALSRLRRFTSCLVLSIHDPVPHKRRLPTRLETTLRRRGWRAADAIVVASPNLRDDLVANFGVDPDRVAVIPLAIPPADVAAPRPPRADGPLRVLFLGTFRVNKGMVVLLDSLQLLDGEGVVECRIAGRGEAALERLVRERSQTLSNVTAHVGFLTDEERREQLSWPDLLVLPYTAFGSQSGVLSRDAYGAGVPVIASDLGALGATIRDDGTGWLVPPGDAAALAACLRQVAGDADGYEEMRRRVRRAAARHSVEAVGAQYVALYRTLCASLRERGDVG